MTEDIKVKLWLPKRHNDGLPFSPQAWETFNIILKSSLDGVTKSDNTGMSYNPDESGRECEEAVCKYEMVIPADRLKCIDGMIKSARDIFGRQCILRLVTDVDAKVISLCYDKRIDRDSFTIEMKNRYHGIIGLTLPFNSRSFALLDALYNKPVSPGLLIGSDSPFKSVKFKHGDPSEQIEWLSTHCESIVIYGDAPMLENHAENDLPLMADCCW